MPKALRHRSVLGLASLLAWTATAVLAQEDASTSPASSRVSLARVLADTIERDGFDRVAVEETLAAIRQQKANDPEAYAVDEDELHELWRELLVTGRLDAALAVAGFRVEEFPGSPAAHRALGESRAELGQEREAKASWARALELDPGGDPRERRAVEHLLAGRKSLARALETALRRAAGDGDALERAAIDYRKRPERYFVDEDAMERLGGELLSAERVDEALAVLALEARAHPESWSVYDRLGDGYLARGDVRRAIESYQRSLAIHPQNAHGADMLAKIRDEMYLLPYPEGESYLLLQGNDGPFGHQGAIAYAFDFRMPIGTPVHAARGGEVVAVETRFDDGTRKPGEENYVFVEHSDGSFGRYYHLRKAGAVVAEGDRVERGQRIGWSGDSGASAGPHLHFDVTTECPEWGCQTIPITFANAASNPLESGEPYQALPMPGR